MNKYIKESDVYALFPDSGVRYLHVADIDQLPRVEFNVPTRFERIQAMNIDELSEFLSSIVNSFHEAGYHGNSEYGTENETYCSYVLECPMKESCNAVLRDKSKSSDTVCSKESIKQWLNEKSSEELI